MSGKAPTEMPPEDDDQTVPGPAGRARPSGAEPLTSHNALPPGTRLDEFEILRVLGAGGFGIVYLAHDHVLQRRVAIKEYMPSLLARRGAGRWCRCASADAAETLRAASNRSSTRRGCSRASTIRRWSRCIASGRQRHGLHGMPY